jgi:hypothetical protein
MSSSVVVNEHGSVIEHESIVINDKPDPKPEPTPKPDPEKECCPKVIKISLHFH